MGGKSIYISYLDVFNNNIIDFLPNNYVNIKNAQNKVKIGDVLIPTSSETIIDSGMASVFNFKTEKNIYLNSFCFGVRPYNVKNIEPNFLAYLLRTKNIRNKIIKLSQGISRYNLNVNNFLNTQINIPINKREMQKISLLIDNLRKSITLLQRKLEKMKNIKEFLLKKMFISGQDKIPTIRFKEFNNSWDKKQVGDILYENNIKGAKDLEVLTATKYDGMQPRKNLNLTISFNTDNIIKFNKVDVNDFVLHLSTFQNGLAFSEYIGVTSPAYKVLKIKNLSEDYPKYFEIIFKSKNFINKLIPITYGIRMGKTILFNDLKNIEVDKPEKREQEKIYFLTKTLFWHIKLLEKKKEKLENIKKTLLNKMFI
ncbi:restriction endonuclease subunit S [Mycoplasma sp. CSL10137]|uniref:restriction endonuclease subunit S n=1 Tax=Mycoplasma sp. CSL10137 TaxID=2813824 RepID=UPI00197C44EB|nr:restriction endonuclease subunit S [Mycoplasma sp. CSL10137]MBN4083593.1 restriction endonuclease subunit S [Mycoplasma sp. CSL10137]